MKERGIKGIIAFIFFCLTSYRDLQKVQGIGNGACLLSSPLHFPTRNQNRSDRNLSVQIEAQRQTGRGRRRRRGWIERKLDYVQSVRSATVVVVFVLLVVVIIFVAGVLILFIICIASPASVCDKVSAIERLDFYGCLAVLVEINT